VVNLFLMFIAMVVCNIVGYSARFLYRTTFWLLTGQPLFMLHMLIYVLLLVEIACSGSFYLKGLGC
jgi:hypothetical protein